MQLYLAQPRNLLSAEKTALLRCFSAKQSEVAMRMKKRFFPLSLDATEARLGFCHRDNVATALGIEEVSLSVH